MKKNYDYFLLAAALISVGAILVLSDTCYRYPPELRWLENSNAVGVIGIISGLLLIYWAAIPYEKPLLIATALVAAVFFWSSVIIFELMHDQAYTDLHSNTAVGLEIISQNKTFILIFRSEKKKKKNGLGYNSTCRNNRGNYSRCNCYTNYNPR